MLLRGSRDKSQRNRHQSKEEEQCIRDQQAGHEEEEQCRRVDIARAIGQQVLRRRSSVKGVDTAQEAQECQARQ